MRVTPAQASLFLKRAAVRLEREIMEAERTNLREAKRIAIRLSQGPYKTIQLIRMGHPYARRAPNPPQDPAIINYQTGVFASSWVTVRPFWIGADINAALLNTAPYSWYMLGTRLMIERPIYKRIAAKIELLRYRRFERAVERSLIPRS